MNLQLTNMMIAAGLIAALLIMGIMITLAERRKAARRARRRDRNLARQAAWNRLMRPHQLRIENHYDD